MEHSNSSKKKEDLPQNTRLPASERLKMQKLRILRLWEKQVVDALPAAKECELPALMNTLPTVIDQLIETLAHPKPQLAIQANEDKIAISHGTQRAQLERYTLDQVISEYRILRNILFEVLEENSPLELREREIISDAIFLSTRNASAEFSRIRAFKQEQAHHDLNQEVQRTSVELAFAQELLKNISLGVQDYAIFTIDTNGIITTWSLGAARMKQYTAEEAIGHHFSMLYPEDGRLRNEPMSHLSAAAVEGRFRGEGLRVKKSGEHFLADVLITPMYKNENLIGYSKVVQDLTERNQLIQERDLSHSEVKGLKTESKLRERFVYTLAHDLRNPLSAAQACAQMILKTPCSASRHSEFAGLSIASILRVDRMITDLLDVSRIKAGEPLPLKMKECNLRKLVDDVCEELATIHGDRFIVQSDQSVIGYWDSEGLVRVLENLIGNAIKYGDRSTPVTITVHQRDSRVHLKVHNYGPVIRPEDQVFLYEPFHRTKSAQTQDKKGWGLGLTLVRGITAAHNGVLLLESYPKEGTTFTVDLPRDPRK